MLLLQAAVRQALFGYLVFERCSQTFSLTLVKITVMNCRVAKEEKMKNREYRGEFSCWDDVTVFGGTCPKTQPRFVFAEYQTPSYEGYSTVIISDDGRNFSVVEGSHCSCYGLENQWSPTEHDRTEINKMMEASYGFFHDHRADLVKWLKHIS
jgi:hypothetical protein